MKLELIKKNNVESAWKKFICVNSSLKEETFNLAMQNLIRITYYAFKQEIIFERMDGNILSLDSFDGHKTVSYKDKQNIKTIDNFLLDNQGDKIYQDLLEAFDNPELLTIEAKCTNEDFKYLTSLYETFIKKEHIALKHVETIKSNEEVLTILRDWEDEHVYSLVEDEKVNLECLKSLKEAIINDKNHTENDRNKDKHPISLCFVGPMSSGKSSLINALIKEDILPTDSVRCTTTVFELNQSKSLSIVLKVQEGDVINTITIPFQQFKGFQCPYNRFLEDADNANRFKRNSAKAFKYLLTCINKDQINLTNPDIKKVIINYDYDISTGEENEPLSFQVLDIPGSGSEKTCDTNILMDTIKNDIENCIVIFVKSPQNTGTKDTADLLEEIQNIKPSSSEAICSLNVNQIYFVTTHLSEVHNPNEIVSLKNDIWATSNKDKKLLLGNNKKQFFVDSFLGSNARKEIVEDDDYSYMFYEMYRDTERINNLINYFNYDLFGSSTNKPVLLQNRAKQALIHAENKDQAMFVKSGLYSLIDTLQSDGRSVLFSTKANSKYLTIKNFINNLIEEADNCINKYHLKTNNYKETIKKDIKKSYLNIKNIECDFKDISYAKSLDKACKEFNSHPFKSMINKKMDEYEFKYNKDVALKLVKTFFKNRKEYFLPYYNAFDDALETFKDKYQIDELNIAFDDEMFSTWSNNFHSYASKCLEDHMNVNKTAKEVKEVIDLILTNYLCSEEQLLLKEDKYALSIKSSIESCLDTHLEENVNLVLENILNRDEVYKNLLIDIDNIKDIKNRLVNLLDTLESLVWLN